MKENILKLVFNDITNITDMNETIGNEFIGALIRFDLKNPSFIELLTEIKKQQAFEITVSDELIGQINQLEFKNEAFQFLNSEHIDSPSFKQQLELFENRYYFIEDILLNN